MPEEAFLNEELGIIEVRSRGIVACEDLLDAIDKLRKLEVLSGIHKVLVDTSQELQLPRVVDLESFGERIPRSLKVAIVMTRTQPTAEGTMHIRNVAYLKGTQIECFPTREDALRWLLDQPKILPSRTSVDRKLRRA